MEPDMTCTAASRLLAGHDWRDDAEALLIPPRMDSAWPDSLERYAAERPSPRRAADLAMDAFARAISDYRTEPSQAAYLRAIELAGRVKGFCDEFIEAELSKMEVL